GPGDGVRGVRQAVPAADDAADDGVREGVGCGAAAGGERGRGPAPAPGSTADTVSTVTAYHTGPARTGTRPGEGAAGEGMTKATGVAPTLTGGGDPGRRPA